MLIRPGVELAAIAVLLSVAAGTQDPKQALQPQSQQGAPASGTLSRAVRAVGYQVGGGDTTIDLRSTGLLPQASGEAKVEAKPGITNIDMKVTGMQPANKLGTEFLTYVAWVVSPDGGTSNVGEIVTNDRGEGKLKATTQLQTFALFVTAEPYFAVRQPSELVVLENAIRKDTKGKLFTVTDYKLMRRNQYDRLGNPLALSLDLKNVPLEMYEARNAVDIARSRAAERYAPDIFTKAESSLKMAENALARKADKREVISTAKQAVQFAEDARTLSAQKQEEERIANERAAAAERAKAEAETKAAAESAEAKRRADEEASRQAELAAAREAKLKAEAAARAAQLKAEADAAAAKEEAAKAEAERATRAAEDLRAQLLQQLNRILETRDTPRGLVVTMGEVLFETGKYDVRPEAREKLARLAGIVLAHPGLTLTIEGHTDNTGSAELNQKLSDQRAAAVLNYLQSQGLPPQNLSARGFGATMPAFDNSTPDGRRRNRRVEIIISGEAIGTKVGR